MIDKKCYIISVYCFNRGFLIFGQLYLKQSSAIRSQCLTQQHYDHSHVTNRGPTTILYLLPVGDENGYARGRKWIGPRRKRILYLLVVDEN
jgi:hypothetical protein